MKRQVKECNNGLNIYFNKITRFAITMYVWTMYLTSKEKKRYKKFSLHLSTRKYPLTKVSPTLTLPLRTWLLSYPKLLPLFCHGWQKANNSSNHLVVTGRASILIVGVTIINLVLRCHRRRRGRRDEATKASLPSCNMIDTGVHLTQLINECVKASIHALKLRHDHFEGHTTHRRRKSGFQWSGRG